MGQECYQVVNCNAQLFVVPAGQKGCDVEDRLAYYICLWVVIGIVGIWFFVGVAWMAVMWVYPSESSLPDALHTLDEVELEVADSGHLAEV